MKKLSLSICFTILFFLNTCIAQSKENYNLTELVIRNHKRVEIPTRATLEIQDRLYFFLLVPSEFSPIMLKKNTEYYNDEKACTQYFSDNNDACLELYSNKKIFWIIGMTGEKKVYLLKQ